MLGQVNPGIAYKKCDEGKEKDDKILPDHIGHEQGEGKCCTGMSGRKAIGPVDLQAIDHPDFFCQHHNGAEVAGKDHAFEEMGEHGADDQGGQHGHKKVSFKYQYIKEERNPDQAITQVGPETEYIVESRMVIAVDHQERMLFTINYQENTHAYGKDQAEGYRHPVMPIFSTLQ